MARFWRLISLRWRMRSTMLMAVLTSRGLVGPSLVLVSVHPKHAAPEDELPNNQGVIPRTCLTIEGREIHLPCIRKHD
jgi:hypothetical protein